jgi:hypothetical protein
MKLTSVFKQILLENFYGDYLFADKDSGVGIGWYPKEFEVDTPAEKNLFRLLGKYVRGEDNEHKNINLDSLIPIFRKLKRYYPDVVDPKLDPNSYIYRGTVISSEKLKELSLESVNSKIDPDHTHEIIEDKIYRSNRNVNSWSTDIYVAAHFAFSSRYLNDNTIPIIIRAKVKDADLYFKPSFIEKLNQYNDNESETFNIINPIKADIIILYDDENDIFK